MAVPPPIRSRVIRLYRELYHLGRDYPAGAQYFHTRLKQAFHNNRHVDDPELIEQLLAKGEFVKKEIEALYALKKYRFLKQRYYREHHPAVVEAPPDTATSSSTPDESERKASIVESYEETVVVAKTQTDPDPPGDKQPP